MNRLGQLVAVCLLLVILASSFSAGQASIPSGRQSTDSVSPLLVEVEPAEHVATESDPAAFAVVLRNPSETETKQVFLTVGANTTDDEFSMAVADGRPWYQREEKTLWASNLHLDPGGSKFLGVVVYPESPSGTYEINATAAFLHDGNYTQASSVSNLTIPEFSAPSDTTTSSSSSPSNPLAALGDWLRGNWVWLIPLLSLVVAVLSFFGYERVKNTLAAGHESDERGE
jgi:hypothetical protein